MLNKYKRAIQFGAMLWLVIFFVFSILIFLPPLQDKELLQYIMFWVLLIPITLGLCKWYFKASEPTWQRGLTLGFIAIVVGTILDLIFTQLFIEGSYRDFLNQFYGEWKLYVGFLELLVLTTFAGAEFDATYSKDK